VLGYSLRIVKGFLNIPKTTEQFVLQSNRLRENQEKLKKNQLDLEQQLLGANSRLDSANSRIADLSYQMSTTSHKQVLVNKVSSVSGLVDDHLLDNFYIDFENNFRGKESDVKKRLKIYVPYIKQAGTNFTKYPVLDIGCGRGEFLELLKEEGIEAIGLDLNRAMIELNNKKGLKVVEQDALSYLSKLKTGSLSAITGFHIVEHIVFDELVRIADECFRVLRPGGVLIFETPNPENLVVGTSNFYLDPSHLHPLPPDLLSFSIKARGFSILEVLRLHPLKESYYPLNSKNEAMNEVLNSYFGPQDYCVIGKKP
jgi:O-antigen chain-terminating methyltransferase